jgi:uncharacterized protein (DUF1330 family)
MKYSFPCIVSTFCLVVAAMVQPAMAQGKPAYLVSELDLKDANAYMNDYAPKIRAVYAKYGATFVVGTANVQAVDQTGAAPQRMVIAKFESMEKAQAYLKSAERAALVPMRDKIATIKSYLVEGN